MDVTKGVMDQVISFERRRVKLWRVVFWLAVGGLGLIIIISLVQAWQIIQERGTFDLLTLFVQDQEVIAEFWQDSLVTFYEELPHRRLTITILVTAVIALVFLATKKIRRILQKKLEQLQNYPNKTIG